MPGAFVPTTALSQENKAHLQYSNPHPVLDTQEASSGVSNDACSTKIGIGVCIVLALFFIGFVAMEYSVLK